MKKLLYFAIACVIIGVSCKPPIGAPIPSTVITVATTAEGNQILYIRNNTDNMVTQYVINADNAAQLGETLNPCPQQQPAIEQPEPVEEDTLPSIEDEISMVEKRRDQIIYEGEYAKNKIMYATYSPSFIDYVIKKHNP